MGKLKNNRHERFCMNICKGMSQVKAYVGAGYVDGAGARAKSTLLATKDNIIVRIEELRDKIVTKEVMSIQERKERLSELAHARLANFIKAKDDRVSIKFDEYSPDNAAVQEIGIDTRHDKGDSDGYSVFSKLKLHDPVKAIQELNKMDGAYPKQELDLNLKNVQIVIPGNKRTKS